MHALGPTLYAQMGISGNALEIAVSYSSTIFAGATLIWLFNLLMAVVRGTGGRAGRWIRAVSRDSAPGGCGFGGNAMRTVSFFGSVKSAMNRAIDLKTDCSKIARLSLVNFELPRRNVVTSG